MLAFCCPCQPIAGKSEIGSRPILWLPPFPRVVTDLPPSSCGRPLRWGQMNIDLQALLEADHHCSEAHRSFRRQTRIVAQLSASGKSSHASTALLSLMVLMLPIVEDLRQQVLVGLSCR